MNAIQLPRPAPRYTDNVVAIPEFCETCTLLQQPMDTDDAGSLPLNLADTVESRGPYLAGEHLFHQGDRCDALYAVRNGAVKIRRATEDGREQVSAFYLPGDLIGLRALYAKRFPYDAVALDATYVCWYPLLAVQALACSRPNVQQHLLRLLARELRTAQCLAADHPADARVAAFLVQLGERYGRSSQSATAFRLCMSRADIGNYLRLATETVSRVLTRFRTRRWIWIEAHYVKLLALDQLRRTGKALLAY